MGAWGTGIFENDTALNILDGLETVTDVNSLRAVELCNGLPIQSLDSWLHTATVHVALVGFALSGKPVSCIKEYIDYENIVACIKRIRSGYIDPFRRCLDLADVVFIIHDLKKFPYVRIYGRDVGNQVKGSVFDFIREVEATLQPPENIKKRR